MLTKDRLKSGLLSVIIYVNFVDFTQCLTGHVCSRQKAETYQVTYDRGFICPERYTTVCGHLDWRRCTKYRVSTCYTPTQKYAIRYYVVEECCPGWKDEGGGRCTVPVCAYECENGGSCCVSSNGIPGCSCPGNYYGSRCQYGKHTERLLLVACLAFLICALLAIGLHCYCRNLVNKRSNIQELVHLKRLNLKESKKLLSDTDYCSDIHGGGNENGITPSAPATET